MYRYAGCDRWTGAIPCRRASLHVILPFRLGISEVTFYRWRKEYGGMSGAQLRRLKGLRRRTSGCAARSRT